MKPLVKFAALGMFVACFAATAPAEPGAQLERPHLVLHLVTPTGQPVLSIPVVHLFDDWTRSSRWRPEPSLMVTLSPGAADALGERARYLEAHSSTPGEYVVELSDPVRAVGALDLDVGVMGGAARSVWQRVHVPADAGRVEVSVVMPPAGRTGALALEVRDEAGNPITKDVRVRLVDPHSGVVLLGGMFHPSAELARQRRLEMPEGEYRLCVEGVWEYGPHGWAPRPRIHGAYETHLRIIGGAEEHVTAVLGQPARLDVRVLGHVTAQDRQAVPVLLPREISRLPRTPAELEADREAEAAHVSLRLEQADCWPEPVWIQHGEDWRPEYGPWVALGSRVTSEPLSPGTYTLVATTPSGSVFKRPATLVPGQTLSVTLRFD